MRTTVARVAAGAGAAATLAAPTVLPWAAYGDQAMSLHRFPDRWWYVAAGAGLTLVTLWAAYGPEKGRRFASLVGCVLTLATLAAVALVLSHYREATTLFGPIVPMVIPTIGPGGPVAVLGALAGGVASLSRLFMRHAT
jgi:hypothetical protein